MVSERIRKTTYDDRNDILSISFTNDRGMSYSDGGPIGFEIMKDMETDQMTGLIIYYPVRKQMDRQQKLNDLGFDFKISDFIR